MTKAEFVDHIAGSFDSKKAAADAVDAVLDGIQDTLAGGGSVNFTGFGKFSVSERAARQGVNPRTGERITIAAGPRAEVLGGRRAEVQGQGRLTQPATAFADRLAALVDERRSQVCVGLDPDPTIAGAAFADVAGDTASDRAGEAVALWCERVVELAGPACVAAKLQLACFERLGAPGWLALERAVAAARSAGLLVIADGKRGDVPVSAAAYAQALLGATPTPWGEVPGLGADAATVNGILGADSLEPLIDAAATQGAGLFVLVRTSNPGAADLLDRPADGAPFHEQIAELVAVLGPRLRGSGGLSGLGAVVGATEPEHIARLRSLMPEAIFLLPGVGAQGGSAAELGAAFEAGPAAAIVTASRSIVQASDPTAAAEALRAQVWDVACRAGQTG